MTDLLSELCAMLDAAGARITFSAHCITGLVGDACACSRCCEEQRIEYDEDRAKREATLARRAHAAGHSLAAAVLSRKRDDAIAMLRAVEWKGNLTKDHACPVCRGEKPDHKQGCALAATLGGVR